MSTLIIENNKIIWDCDSYSILENWNIEIVKWKISYVSWEKWLSFIDSSDSEKLAIIYENELINLWHKLRKTSSDYQILKNINDPLASVLLEEINKINTRITELRLLITKERIIEIYKNNIWI